MDFFDTEEDKAQREAMANAAGEVIESMDDPVGAQKTLFVCGLIELGIFGTAFFAPRFVAGLQFEFLLFLHLVLFACGFLIGFALFRLYQFRFSKQRETASIDAGVMGGFQYYSQQQQKWRIWVAASATAVVSVVAFNIFQSIFYR